MNFAVAVKKSTIDKLWAAGKGEFRTTSRKLANDEIIITLSGDILEKIADNFGLDESLDVLIERLIFADMWP